MNRPKILLGALYPSRVASTRLRLNSLITPLEEAGAEVETWSFLSNAEVDSWLEGGPSRLLAARKSMPSISIAKRAARSSDIVVVQRELLPFNTLTIERAAIEAGAAIVWDLDDSLWQTGPKWRALVRGSSHKYSWLAKNSSQVWAGNAGLVDWCSAHGVKNAMVIPTTTTLPTEVPGPEGRERVLAWIGTQSTGPFIEALLRSFPFAFLNWTIEIIGAKITVPPGLTVLQREWSPDAEDDLLRRAWAGLYPIDSTLTYALGKSAFKAHLYMSYGVPVLATRTPSNVAAMRDTGAGLIVDYDWPAAVSAVADESTHNRMSRAALTYARLNLDNEEWARKLAKKLLVLHEARHERASK